MSTFKVGDKVRCVKGFTVDKKDKVVKGKNYYVVKVLDKNHVCINNDASNLSWGTEYFKKVPSNGKRS